MRWIPPVVALALLQWGSVWALPVFVVDCLELLVAGLLMMQLEVLPVVSVVLVVQLAVGLELPMLQSGVPSLGSKLLESV